MRRRGQLLLCLRELILDLLAVVNDLSVVNDVDQAVLALVLRFDDLLQLLDPRVLLQSTVYVALIVLLRGLVDALQNPLADASHKLLHHHVQLLLAGGQVREAARHGLHPPLLRSLSTVLGFFGDPVLFCALDDSGVVPSYQFDRAKSTADDKDKESGALDVLEILLGFACVEELLGEVHEGELKQVEGFLVEVGEVAGSRVEGLARFQVDEARVQWFDVDQAWSQAYVCQCVVALATGLARRIELLADRRRLVAMPELFPVKGLA